MASLHEPIELQDSDMISEGKTRRVYHTRAFPNEVLKIMKPRWKSWEKEQKALKRQILRLFPASRDRLFRREMAQSIACLEKADTFLRRPPITLYLGAVQTTLGVAHRYQRIAGAEASSPVSLVSLWHRGQIPEHTDALSELARELLDWSVVCYDLNIANILREDTGASQRFVLIDGFGDNHAIKLRSYLRPFNHYDLHRKLTALAEALNLTWDKERRVFE